MTVKNSPKNTIEVTDENTMENSIIILLILVACLSRLIPHLPNFTAVGAMALFAGAKIGSKRLALFVPLAAMLLSDLFLGFHSTMIFVYGAIALAALIGHWGWKRWQWKGLVGLSLFSSLLFFVITNFGVWLTGGYEQSWQGLSTCFTLAIPFFSHQVVGDLLFTGVIFGFYAVIQALSRRFMAPTI